MATERSYPFRLAPGADPEDLDPELGFTTDVEFSEMFRLVFPSCVVSGLAVFADSSGMQVKVPEGYGFVEGHRYKLTDGPAILAIAANGSGQPRIDTIVLRKEYGTVNAVQLTVVQGTPGASAAPPDLEQTATAVYEFPLADIAVAAGAVTIAPGNVTDRRKFWKQAVREALGIFVGTTAPSSGLGEDGDLYFY